MLRQIFKNNQCKEVEMSSVSTTVLEFGDLIIVKLIEIRGLPINVFEHKKTPKTFLKSSRSMFYNLNFCGHLIKNWFWKSFSKFLTY